METVLNEKVNSSKELSKIQQEKLDEEAELANIRKQYDKFRILLEQKGYARKRRENTETTMESIQSASNSTRYRRRTESQNILEYIHGGPMGSLFGAWDYLQSHAKPELMEKLILSYKRGKFLEKLYGKFTSVLEKSETSLKKAVAKKYHCHLSRRKFTMMCKIQKAAFTESGEAANYIQYGDCNIKMRSVSVSHQTVDSFVKSLDIGEIHQLPGYCGVSRTVSALVSMIVDLNLKVQDNREKLRWFNGNKNHFIVEFSDDGAPESREKTMSIGTLTLWNFESRVRSREYHYPLHLVSAGEKDSICEQLWNQHTEEMLLIESSVFMINNEKITFVFQPSADQAWQYWAVNSVAQNATYPSPYANVHKNDLTKMNCSLSHEEGMFCFLSI